MLLRAWSYNIGNKIFDYGVSSSWKLFETFLSSFSDYLFDKLFAALILFYGTDKLLKTLPPESGIIAGVF